MKARIDRWLGALVLAFGMTLLPVPPASAQAPTAVEFYNAGLDHYFLTHIAAEVALLDAGTTIKGWTRTGQSFNVYGSAAAGTSPVCRFYIPPTKGDSHFYGRGTAECNATGAANPTFVNEDPNFFHVVLPVAGACPAGTRNVYRVFSNRPDANHRYLVDRAIRDQMVAKGWLAEGDGPELVVMCSPVASVAASAAKGIWTGTTDLGETVRAIILDDGTYYMLHSRPGVPGDWGVFQGTADTTGGAFATTDAMAFPVPQASVSNREVAPAALTGSYSPRNTLQLRITDPTGTRNLTAAYDPGSEQPASLAAAAGSYTGFTGHAPGRVTATFTLGADGKLAGANEVCRFAGTVSARDSIGVFDVTIATTQGACAFGDRTSGIMLHDAATQQLRAYLPFFQRSDQYFMIGTRR